MTTSYGYGICECYQCYRRVSKAEARRITIDRFSGYSSGSYRFGRRSVSYSTGRTYHSERDVWICNDCYDAQKWQSAGWWGVGVVVVAIIVVINHPWLLVLLGGVGGLVGLGAIALAKKAKRPSAPLPQQPLPQATGEAVGEATGRPIVRGLLGVPRRQQSLPQERGE
jgi:hypothetical protein